MSMTDMNSPVRIGGFTDEATQSIIAPVQKTLVATKNYAKDDLFIFNNGLYKVTTAIAQGGDIIIGTSSGCNAQADSTLAEELIQRVNTISMLKAGIFSKTVSASQGAASVTFIFDAIPNATINAIIPISFGVSLTYTGMTGLIVSSVDINSRSVSYRIFGTTPAQNITCKAIILYTLNS